MSLRVASTRLALAAMVSAAAGAQSPAAVTQRPTAEVERPTAEVERPTADGRGPTLAGSALDEQTRAVASELRCPVCQGESIQESPAELAQEMKSIVRDQLAAGRTPDEVKAYFVERYGEWILLRPTTTGVNALLYWLPPIVLIAGGMLVVVLARRWMRAARTADPSTLPMPDDV